MVEFGLGIQGDRSFDDYVAIARAAEDAGFDVISVYSDLMYQPAIVPLTVMAGATQRIRLGPACLNPFSLAPFEIAGQIAALDLVSSGRAYLGLSRGAWLDQVGVAQRAPVAALGEAIEVVRRLLAGDTSGFEGEVFRLASGTGLHYAPFPRRSAGVDRHLGTPNSQARPTRRRRGQSRWERQSGPGSGDGQVAQRGCGARRRPAARHQHRDGSGHRGRR